MTRQRQTTVPIRAVGVQHLIDRTYREGGRYQWAREVAQNALEAGATKVHFGVLWDAVERNGVYRRYVADNGQGMTREQLLSFFSSFGGGGKAIGGHHDNFGVGSKTSLLPWNQYGLVVVSWTGGVANMVWIRRDPTTGEYGLRLMMVAEKEGTPEETESLEAVYHPYQDDTAGVDWRMIRPAWIRDHGTVVVMLGNKPDQDTVLGDPARDEADLKGLATYLNKRYWSLPDNIEVKVEELRNNDRRSWPTSRDAARGRGEGATTRTNWRDVKGAYHYVSYQKATNGNLAHAGAVNLTDGTMAHWFLWEGGRPGVHSYAAEQGFLAGLYRGELYDTTDHLATYRSFGVTAPEVRRRLWLVMEPRAYDPATGKGVYPRTDRNSLILQTAAGQAGPLPYANWGAEFADRMPTAIKDALRLAAGDTGTVEDPTYRDRLADRFGSRWRVPRLRAIEGGPLTVEVGIGGEGAAGRVTAERAESERGDGETKDESPVVEPAAPQGAGDDIPRIGAVPGSSPAKAAKMGVGVPSFRRARADEMSPGSLAAWSPHEPGHPEGVVLLNVEHPVLVKQVAHWQAQYADHQAEEVAREVVDTYGQSAVAKVAHSEHLKGMLGAVVVEQECRSEASLTMALLGLVDQDVAIATRLGAKLGRQKSHPSHPRESVKEKTLVAK